MTEAIFNQLSNVPKSALQSAAVQTDMPNANSATKEEIAQWLTQNKPDVAKQVLTDPAKFTS